MLTSVEEFNMPEFSMSEIPVSTIELSPESMGMLMFLGIAPVDMDIFALFLLLLFLYIAWIFAKPIVLRFRARFCELLLATIIFSEYDMPVCVMLMLYASAIFFGRPLFECRSCMLPI